MRAFDEFKAEANADRPQVTRFGKEWLAKRAEAEKAAAEAAKKERGKK